jgi:outer membrane lipoprotein-sorting protein
VTAEAASTQSVLEQLDRAATSFRGMTARLNKSSFTAIIKETVEESGRIALRVDKKNSVSALLQFEAPDVKSIAFRDKKAQIYLPKINTVQEYDLGKYDALLSQGLLIGFATPIKELERKYRISVAGGESIEGRKCHKLELLPTTAAIKQHIVRIELWIAENDGLPVRQKLHQPSGDFTQIFYTDMKLEPALTDDQVRLRLPANVKREFPQK